MKILPSLLAANPLFLGATIELLDPHVDGYHLDVMDGHCVPAINGGVLWVNAIAKATTRALSVHLMTTDPLHVAQQLELRGGVDALSFHIETLKNHKQLIHFLKKNKIRVSIAINPKTPVEQLLPVLGIVDQILVMSVEPGRSGQQFICAALDKVVRLVAERDSRGQDFCIVIDGGVNAKNIGLIAEHRVDQVVVGSAIFAAPEGPLQALADLRERIMR